MRRRLTTIAAVAIALTFAGGSASGAGTLGDASADKVHASIVVPDRTRKVGEVRLLSRGTAVVVQTLLATKLLSRVISEIASKEKRNWPDAAHAGAAAEYLAALRAARERLEKNDTESGSSERRRRMLIEFAADNDEAAVLVGTFTATGDVGELQPQTREIFSTLALPPDYILREIRLILADSFKVDEKDVDKLGPLGPAAASAPKGAATPAPPGDAASAPKGAAN